MARKLPGFRSPWRAVTSSRSFACRPHFLLSVGLPPLKSRIDGVLVVSAPWEMSDLFPFPSPLPGMVIFMEFV
ncbi:MAG TPA: hypothetical protein PL064_07855, partial [Thermogutta sp.]|nr:hypothetical protein [Thermogutta sp.]